jgi:hypothetical protein
MRKKGWIGVLLGSALLVLGLGGIRGEGPGEGDSNPEGQ